MNALFLSELFYPHGGGAELATYLYAKLLAESGVNVIVVTNKFAGEQKFSKVENVIVYRFPFFKSRLGVKHSTLRRLDVPISSFIKELMEWSNIVYVPRLWYSMIPVAKAYKRPVIVHVHDYSPICPLAIMYDSSKEAICGKESICSARCIYQFEKNKGSNIKESILSLCLNLFAKTLSRKLIEQADAVLCVSEAQRDILVRHFPLIGCKTHVIYNPLPDLPAVDIEGEDFGYFGGLNLLKGFGVLYKAVAFLNSASLRVHVTGLADLTERMIKSFDRVGMVPCRKLAYDKQEGFYGKIEGVIFPSIVPEPLPYVTAEAILRGRILIASKIGGIVEQVKGCKGVFLFEAGNYHELAEILEYVKGLDKETIIGLGFQNREVFVKTFNNETTINEFLDIVTCLI